MDTFFTKPILFLLVLVLIAGGIYFLQSNKAVPGAGGQSDTSISVQEERETNSETSGDTSEGDDNQVAESVSDSEPIARVQSAETCSRRSVQKIVNPSGYVNTGDEPITIEEFVGEKVILIDFLTYSCFNCQNTFPYVNAWHEKYKDAGLQIIGIHTPEFAFEEEKANVVAAAEKFGLEHPLVLDNDYSTWRAYENRYWPRKYLVDINGCIVYDRIGEGAYEETERNIQTLLEERKEKRNLDVEVPGGTVNP